jgi:tetratricopeptide (TPR) repeat protein
MRSLPLLLALALVVPAVADPAKTPAPQPPAVEGHEHDTVDPKDETTVDYLWRKSDEAFHNGDYNRAVGLHKAIVVLAPDDVESYSVAAWLLWSMERGPEAMAFIQRGLDANPNDPEMWDAAGQHYDLQKKLPEAQKAYAKAVELSGKDAPQLLRRRYAHAAEHAGDWATSLTVWQALVKDYPNEAVNRNNLARVQKTIQDNKDGKTPTTVG